MTIETENIQNPTKPDRPLDGFDRKILSALAANGRETYTKIGDQVGLSAPAVYERVRRMAESGVLLGTAGRIDGP